MKVLIVALTWKVAAGISLRQSLTSALNDKQSSDGWDWATTTRFDAEEVWPGTWVKPSLELDRISSEGDDEMETSFGLNAVRGGRIAVAVPWVEVLNTFGGRKAMVQSVIDSASGASTDESCYLVQPIKVIPGSGFQVPDLQTESAVVPLAKDGKSYVYLAVPYQGCGGDSNVGTNDVFNGCAGKISDAVTLNGFVNADQDAWNSVCSSDFLAENEECRAICTLWKNGKLVPPTPDTDSEEAFLRAGSCVIGVSERTQYGQKTIDAKNYWVSQGVYSASSHCATFTNWCSGANMHMDTAASSPAWLEHYGATDMANLDNDDGGTNIYVRYRRVQCNIWGNFDPTYQGPQ